MNSHSSINISEGGRKPGVVGKNEQCGNSAQTELRTSLEVLGKNTAQKLCVSLLPRVLAALPAPDPGSTGSILFALGISPPLPPIQLCPAGTPAALVQSGS